MSRDSIMVDPSHEAVVLRLRIALDLFRVGTNMMQNTLRRKHADASARDIERMMFDWIRTRPGAEHGDAVGRVVHLADSE